MKVTDQERSAIISATEFLEWLTAESRDGVLAIGTDQPERYRRGFDLADDDALIEAGAFAVALGLSAALPLYRPDASYYDDVTILRCHVSAIRFAAGTEPADVLELASPPQVLVWLGDDAPCWALWGLWESMDGGDLLGVQVRERGLSGGDPDWDGSPSSPVPIPGVSYVVNGVEREAVEWPVP
ncbi:MAG TPA: hypothetical protein VHA80_09085 [Solirubrobacterales bacterium]|nr:hypothetical protein [Solirubrobacterales bacterium]